MKLTRLRIDSFRNYEKEEIIWDEAMNIICGLNAQGKSNLLEAISYLSLASSFRQSADSELIGWGKDFFFLEGDVKDRQRKLTIIAAYDRKKGRHWKINGMQKQKLQEILGYFHTVVFSPEDLDIVKSGPQSRRRQLNRQMVQLFPEYCSLLVGYNKVLKQRNTLLKSDWNRDVRNELTVWDTQLADFAGRIIRMRLDTVFSLSPLAQEIHGRLSKQEKLTMEYQSLLPQTEMEKMAAKDLADVFLKKLESIREAEFSRGMTLVGPHRDDLLLRINGISARNFASQGQQRTVALSWKLAELELAFTTRGEYPVLLLDDVMSELDINRREQLLFLMRDKAQTFITATDINFSLKGGKKIIISQGKISG